jgi:hypothetical protein
MLTRYIALVSEAPKIELAELVAVAAALQKQVTRDFGPIWGVQANVSAFARLEEVPLDYWPVILKDNLARPEAAGYHEDDLGEPCSLVRLTDDWSVTASHETLEMLADPWGRHLVAGQSPRRPKDRVKFLVEVCDPCSNASYKVNGIAVSDFYTPHFFDPVPSRSVRYSFAGNITKPRQVLKGGYLTWYEPASRKWWHRAWFNGPRHADAEIPIPDLVKGNIRSAIDHHLAPKRARGKQNGSGGKLRQQREEPGKAFLERASDIRRSILSRS